MQKMIFIKLVVAIVSAASLIGCDKPKPKETPTTQPPIFRHAERIQNALPEGWSAEVKDNRVIVQRDKKASGKRVIINDSDGGYKNRKPELWTYTIGLEFAPPITEKQYRKMVDENRMISEKLAAMQEKMRHITHKFDSYVSTKPAEEKLITEYEALKKKRRRLPDLFVKDAAVFVEREPISGFMSFEDPKDAAECFAVRKAIESLFSKVPLPEQDKGK